MEGKDKMSYQPLNNKSSAMTKIGVELNIKGKIFYVEGEDFFYRRKIIEDIKNKLLKNSLSPLNVLTFYGKDIELARFQEKVFSLSFNQENILIIKDSYRLSSEIKNFIFLNIEKILSSHYVIFEIDGLLPKDKKISADKLFNFILKNAVLFRNSTHKVVGNLDDFKRGIRQKNLSSSLYSLKKLFEDNAKARELAPFILGIMVQECSYLRNHKEREKMLSSLWELDRLIKEKGLDSRLAIEIFLVKLFGA